MKPESQYEPTACAPASCGNGKCLTMGRCTASEMAWARLDVGEPQFIPSPPLVPPIQEYGRKSYSAAELRLAHAPKMRPALPAPPPRKRILDADSATRKTFPMAAGLLDYFPDALAAVAAVSHAGNEKHNPGEPLHHARGKSMDHADCIMRHLVGRGGFDGDMRESAALAWRALALLQEELEREMGLPLPRSARPA